MNFVIEDAKEELMDSIRSYVRACGGDPDQRSWVADHERLGIRKDIDAFIAELCRFRDYSDAISDAEAAAEAADDARRAADAADSAAQRLREAAKERRA